MHIYIYDSFLNQKKYNNILTKIETRITDLGLNGKISRLGALKNVRDAVERELRAGAKTITAVGNNQTINQVAGALVKANIPLGIIPVGRENNSIAGALGIKSELSACDILSARRIEKLDLGLANNQIFLEKASITNQGTLIEINDCSIEILEDGQIEIINFSEKGASRPPKGKFDPRDGSLELFIKTKAGKNFFKKIIGQSIFSFTKLFLINKNRPLLLDGSLSLETPVEIGVAKQKLSVIVGKERGF